MDPDSDTNQSQNLIECSLSKTNPPQKFHEHSSTAFWVILFNVYKCHIYACWKVAKLILDPDPELEQSQNLIIWFLAHKCISELLRHPRDRLTEDTTATKTNNINVYGVEWHQSAPACHCRSTLRYTTRSHPSAAVATRQQSTQRNLETSLDHLHNNIIIIIIIISSSSTQQLEATRSYILCQLIH